MTIVSGVGYDGLLGNKIKSSSIKNNILEIALQKELPPWKWDEEKLNEIGVPKSNIPLAMGVICEFILEYYGINGRELRNSKRVSQINISDKHWEILLKRYNIDLKIDEFMQSKYSKEYQDKYGKPQETDNSINVILENNLPKLDYSSGLINLPINSI